MNLSQLAMLHLEGFHWMRHNHQPCSDTQPPTVPSSVISTYLEIDHCQAHVIWICKHLHLQWQWVWEEAGKIYNEVGMNIDVCYHSPCSKPLSSRYPLWEGASGMFLGSKYLQIGCLEAKAKNITINKSKPRLVQVSVDPTINNIHACWKSWLGKNQVSAAHEKKIWQLVGGRWSYLT